MSGVAITAPIDCDKHIVPVSYGQCKGYRGGNLGDIGKFYRSGLSIDDVYIGQGIAIRGKGQARCRAGRRARGNGQADTDWQADDLCLAIRQGLPDCPR